MSKKNIILNINITILTLIVIYILNPVLIKIKDWFLWSLTLDNGQLDKEIMWTAIGSIATVMAVLSGLYVLYRNLKSQIKENKFQIEMQEHNEIVGEFKEAFKQIEPGMIFKSLKYLDIDTNQCYCELIDYINNISRLGYRIALTISTKEYNEIIVKKNNWTESLMECINFQKEKVEEIRVKINELNFNKSYVENKAFLTKLEFLNDDILKLQDGIEKEKLLKKNNGNLQEIQKIIEEVKKYNDLENIRSSIECIKKDLEKESDNLYNIFYQTSKQYLENRKNNILKKYDKL